VKESGSELNPAVDFGINILNLCILRIESCLVNNNDDNEG